MQRQLQPALIPDFVHPIQPFLHHPFYENNVHPLPNPTYASPKPSLHERVPDPEPELDLNSQPKPEPSPAPLDTDLFRIACVSNDVYEVRRCLGRESANRTESHGGFTLLHFAARAGHDQVVRVLIDEGGALIDVTDKEGETALMKAAFAGHFECVKVLTSRGANVNARDRDGWSSLHNSCARGRMDIVRWLVENGAKLNAFSNGGHTPLINAASKGYIEICAYLLEKGADPTLRNKNGETAYDTAAAVEAATLCELLLAAEKKIHVETSQIDSKFDPHEHHSTVLLIVFENQRAPAPLIPFLGPQFSRDGLQSKDIRGPWSIGDRPIASLNEIHLPVSRGRRTFFWLTDWKIDRTAGGDVHGWSYARSWEDAPESWQSDMPLHGGGGWVRRRRWIRSMKRTIDVRAVYHDNFDGNSFEDNTNGEYFMRAERLFENPSPAGDQGSEQHQDVTVNQLARREAAVQILLAGIQTDSNPERVRLATARAQEHLLRAELLTQQVRNNEAAIERDLTDACTESSELHASTPSSDDSARDHTFVIGERSIRVPHSKPPNPGIVIPILPVRLPSVSLRESTSSNDQVAFSSIQNPLFAEESDDSVADPLAAMLESAKQRNTRSTAKSTTKTFPATVEFARPRQVASDPFVDTGVSNDNERSLTDLPDPLWGDASDPLAQSVPNAEQSGVSDAGIDHFPEENDAATSSARDPFVVSTSRTVPRKPAPPRSVLSPRPTDNTSSTRATQYPIARLTRSPLVGGVNRHPVSKYNGISSDASSSIEPMSVPNMEDAVFVSPAIREVLGSLPTSSTNASLSISSRDTELDTPEYSSFPNINPGILSTPEVVNPGSDGSLGSGSSSVPTTGYKWEDNASVSNCRLCNCRFSFFLRKHHCRRCGQIVCDQCSLSRFPLPPSEILYPPSSRGTRIPTVPLSTQTNNRHRLCKVCAQITRSQENITPQSNSTGSPSTSHQGISEPAINLDHGNDRTSSSFQDLLSRFVSTSLEDPSIGEDATSSLHGDLDDDESDNGAFQSAMEGSAMLECPVCGVRLDDLPLDSPENGIPDPSRNEALRQDRRERHVERCFGKIKGGKGVVGLTYAVRCLNGEDEEALASYECGICYEEYAAGQAVARMNCLCTYHRSCIEGWFAHGAIKQCPVHHT